VKSPAKAGVSLAAGYNRITQTRHGLMMYNAHDVYVGASLEAYGEFSQAEVSFLLSLVSDESVVMDVGANYGALTLPIARQVRQVYAFEPQRPVYYALAANLALNCLDNVLCENVALSDQPGFITVPRLDFTAKNNIGGLALGNPGTTGRGFYSVRAETLDEYVTRNRIRQLDLIKVDVEGMEEAVLRGGEKTLRSLRPILYLEADRQDKRPSLMARLDTLGYRFEEHGPPLYNPDNFLRNPVNIWGKNLISLNLVCRPAA
jgi:FkbM family methyltransferase